MSDARRPLSTLLLLHLPFVLLAAADSGSAADADARELLAASEARHRSAAQEYAGRLEVTSTSGKTRAKSWRSWRQGYAGDARMLIRFTAPPEVRGVGYLSLSRPGKQPDQWLYLPSMKRERRIASRDRSASFVGTDFNFEDLEEFDHQKFEVKLLGEAEVEGTMLQRIEARPREKSLYERKLLWLRRDDLYLVRVDSYRPGRKEPSKRLLLDDLAEVDGHVVARRMEMRDLEKGSLTTVWLEELHFDLPQPEDRFTLQNLNREE